MNREKHYNLRDYVVGFKHLRWSAKAKCIVLLALCLVWRWLFLPPLNPRSFGFWLFVTVVAINVRLAAKIIKERNTILCTLSEDLKKCFGSMRKGAATILLIVVLPVLAFSNCLTWEAAGKVADVTVREEEAIANEFSDFSQNSNDYILIDSHSAQELSGKRMAKLDNPSWYELNKNSTLINYQGKRYYLTAIDYGDFFKYLKAGKIGIPGFMLVNAANDGVTVNQEAQFVKAAEPIMYSPSAFGDHDLHRHLRKQFPGLLLGASLFEVDDVNGSWWITTVLQPTELVWHVQIANEFILTNAHTGESSLFAIADAPEWVDNIYTTDYLMKVARWKYAFVNGWVNSIPHLGSQTFVKRTSYSYRDISTATNEQKAAGDFNNFYGYSYTVGREGEILLYTGLTPVNTAGSNSGWLLANTKTGKMTEYQIEGIDEAAAQKAVETPYSSYRFETTFPVPANTAGHKSYIMCVKGKDGLVHGYGVCDSKSDTIIGTASTIDGATEQYLKALESPHELEVQEPDLQEEEQQQPNVTLSSPQKDDVSSEGRGVISSLKTAEIEGTTMFYYEIDGELYRAPVTVNERQVFFKEGDQVKFIYTRSLSGAPYPITWIERDE